MTKAIYLCRSCGTRVVDVVTGNVRRCATCDDDMIVEGALTTYECPVCHVQLMGRPPWVSDCRPAHCGEAMVVVGDFPTPVPERSRVNWFKRIGHRLLATALGRCPSYWHPLFRCKFGCKSPGVDGP